MADDLFVQIFAPTSESKGSIGTAYPVAEDVLLTAAHVIRNRETGKLWSPVTKIEARWWKKKEEAPAFCTEILWDGTEHKLDAMLLRCEFPKSFQDMYSTLTHCTPKPNQDFNTQGFARVEKRDDRNPMTIQGSTSEIAVGTRHFDLIVTAGGPVEVDGWKGASGSPVFVDGRIIGVIELVPDGYANDRLRCVPISVLLDIDDFKKHVVNLDGKAKDDLVALKEIAIAALNRSDEATKALAKELGLAEQDEPSACIEQLIGLNSAETALDRCKRAQISLPAQSDAVKILSNVSLCILPAVFRFRENSVTVMREHIEGVAGTLLSVPADGDCPAIFEVYMAAATGRRTQLRFDGQCCRPSEELFPEEGEIGPKPSLEGVDQFINKKILRQDRVPDALAKGKIKNILRNDLKYGRMEFANEETSYRHYFVYRPGNYPKESIEKMKNDYENLIVFIEWTDQEVPDLALEEQNVLNILGRILAVSQYND